MTYLKYPIVYLLLIFPFGNIRGQFNFKPGYVICTNNDTLKGYINDGSIGKNSRYCSYKANKHSERVIYYPKDIKSYWVDDKKYNSLKLPLKNIQEELFAEVLIEGYASLYKYYKYEDKKYFLTIENSSLIPLTIDEYWITMNEAGARKYQTGDFKITKLFYKDTLEVLLAGSGLETMVKSLNYKDIPIQKIIKDYNSLKERKSLYERDLSKNGNSFGLYSGLCFSELDFTGSRFSTELKNETGVFVPVGFFFNHSMRKISDRISFQFEIYASKLKFKPDFKIISDEIAYTHIVATKTAIPLSVHYSIPLKKWKPSVGFGKEIGINLYSKYQYLRKDTEVTNPIYAGTDYKLFWLQRNGWFADAGVSYQINRRFGVFTRVRIQKQSHLVIEDTFFMKKTFNEAFDEYPINKIKETQLSLQFGVYF